MSCPISGLLVRLPTISEELRNDIKRRIITKQQKLAQLRISLSQTCHHDIKSRAKLSEAIVLEKGGIKELKTLARIPHSQYKVDWASRHGIHSCWTARTNNIPAQQSEVEIIDLARSENNSDDDISIIETTSERISHPSP